MANVFAFVLAAMFARAAAFGLSATSATSAPNCYRTHGAAICGAGDLCAARPAYGVSSLRIDYDPPAALDVTCLRKAFPDITVF